MNAQKLKDLVKGNFFHVRFQKKDGSIRDMTCRREVKAYVKGTGKPAPENIIRVWEVDKDRKGAEAYRSFDIDRLIEVHFGGKVYTREDFED